MSAGSPHLKVARKHLLHVAVKVEELLQATAELRHCVFQVLKDGALAEKLLVSHLQGPTTPQGAAP